MTQHNQCASVYQPEEVKRRTDGPGALTTLVTTVCEVYQHAPAMAEAGGHGISTDAKTGIPALERATPITK
jgi:hypothetical protein